MKTKLLSLFLAFSVFFMSQLITAPKSDAAIGLIIKNRTTTTVGGIGAAASAGIFGAGILLGNLGIINYSLGGIILFTAGSAFFGALGLIILDDNTISDMEFNELDLDSELAKEFTVDEVLMYNAEIEELNAIRKTIQADIADDAKIEESKNMWNEYKQMLHPSTAKVAEGVAASFIISLKKVNE